MTTIIIHNYFRYLFIIAFLIVSNFVSAVGQPKEVITVSTPKFGSDLINVWIHKYVEIHPEVQFQIIDGKKEQADLDFISEITRENQNSYITYVGRYALLPVTTIKNPLYEKLSKKRLDKKELKELFFQGDALQKADKNSKSFFYDELTIYSGTSKTAGANAFASFFGYPTSQLRGKRIAGDDAFLLTAINKDHTGVTFNNLTYIFDLKNRKLKPNLCLIPLDLKREQRDILENGNLDETIELLEYNDIALIPLAKVGFTYRDKAEVADFLRWVVNEGQQYNHSYGFLTLDKKLVHKEQKQLEDKLLSDR